MNKDKAMQLLKAKLFLLKQEENARIASEATIGHLEQADMDVYDKIKEEINARTKVPCTGCGYCMPCPKGIDIPMAFKCYNQMYTEKKKSGRWEYLQCLAFRKDRRDINECINCGKCQLHCPQHIEIRSWLEKTAETFE